MIDIPIAQLLLVEIKSKLKERRITYADFARVLNLSESGLKKQLSARDCSLTKIQKMCTALGISFFDLVESVEGNRLHETQFTKEQEAFFEKDRLGFVLYWLLVYERRPLAHAASVLRLETKKQQALLLRLDRLDLIQLGSNGAVQVPDPLAIRWVGRSPFVLKLYQKWGVSLIMRNLRVKPDENSYFMIRYLQASEQTFREMKADLEAFDIKYSNKATREMRIQDQVLKHIRFLTVMDNESWIESDEIGLDLSN